MTSGSKERVGIATVKASTNEVDAPMLKHSKLEPRTESNKENYLMRTNVRKRIVGNKIVTEQIVGLHLEVPTRTKAKLKIAAARKNISLSALLIQWADRLKP